MVAESVGKLMAGRQIDAQLAKSFEQFRIVRIEQIADGHALRICSPLQKQIEEIPAPASQGQIEWTLALQVWIVTLQRRRSTRAWFRASRAISKAEVVCPFRSDPAAIWSGFPRAIQRSTS
jgi:hypothetical protein